MVRFILCAMCVCIIAQLQSQNVLISNTNNPNEPSIIMDPNHPNVLVAGANLNNYYLSNDTGSTWTHHTLSSSYGVWGDPCLVVDTAGDFYFFHLSNPSGGNTWIDRIVCQKTSDNGTTWNNGSFIGLNSTKKQDKQWCCVDRTNNIMYLTWTQFDQYNSTITTDSSIILFSKSFDGGLTWTTPNRINKQAGDCLDSDNTVEGAIPVVGPNGEIYVSWAGPNGIVFNRSFDQGETWLDEEIFVSDIPGGWNYTISGFERVNGLPVITCDLSAGPNSGTIYINWSDQRNGTENTDIWLVRSDDGGNSWSSPTRVNTDTSTRNQFFTWMTIDQTTGNLFFVFYDRRDYTDDTTDVYLAVSNDGGSTFINQRISESPFNPISSVFFGDYTNITAHNGIVRPIWTRQHNGQLSIWTHKISYQDIITNSNKSKDLGKLSFENYPNPSSDFVYVSFKLRGPSLLDLDLYDMTGKLQKSFMKNEHRDYGKYVEQIDLKELGLNSGIYSLQLKVNGTIKSTRQVFLK